MITYLLRYSVIILGLSLAASVFAKTHWLTIEPGLEYTRIVPNPHYPWAHIHALRINLHHFRLRLYSPEKPTSVKAIANTHGLAIAANSGFFTPEYHPLGLRVSDFHMQNATRPVSWWGVFYTRRSRANVKSLQRFELAPDIDFAIQAGPRLIVKGIIPKLKPGRDERTALGVTRKGRVILLATQNLPLTTTALARIMRRAESNSGLNCYYALNLDGGRSTQLWVNLPGLQIDRSNFSLIPDAIGLTRRAR